MACITVRRRKNALTCSLGFGPHHKVPVIGHCHPRINRQEDDFPRFSHDTHERSIVFRLFTNREPSHCSIQNVEDFTCRTNAYRACHHKSPTTCDAQKKPPPFRHGVHLITCQSQHRLNSLPVFFEPQSNQGQVWRKSQGS